MSRRLGPPHLPIPTASFLPLCTPATASSGRACIANGLETTFAENKLVVAPTPVPSLKEVLSGLR